MTADFCVPPQHEVGMPSLPPDRNLFKDVAQVTVTTPLSTPCA